MAQYTAQADGTPTDWHLEHRGARASGGAGMVMTEMTCVAPDTRITPACPGRWSDPIANHGYGTPDPHRRLRNHWAPPIARRLAGALRPVSAMMEAGGVVANEATAVVP